MYFQDECAEAEFCPNKKITGVWLYMYRNKAKTKAQCMVDGCGTIIKTPNSGTSGCHRHLKNTHDIEVSE